MRDDVAIDREWLRNEMKRYDCCPDDPPEPHPTTGYVPCDDIERLLVTEDWMVMLGVTRETVYSKVRRGQIPKPIKVGRLLRWRRKDVDEWLEGNDGQG